MNTLFRRGRSKTVGKRGSAPVDFLTKSSPAPSIQKEQRRKTLASSEATDSVVVDSKKETPTEFIDDKRNVLISKSIIDFGISGEETCPIRVGLEDRLVIANNSSKKIKFKIEHTQSPNWKIVFEPSSGSIDAVAKKKNTKKIIIKMVLLVEKSVEERIKFIVNGQETYFITVKAHVAEGVFGVNASSLEFIEDAGFQVPKILAQMRHALIEQEAFKVEGIFRLAGNATDMVAIKEEINRIRSFEASDAEVNAIANLIKVWFRELPEPILNLLPTETIHNSGEIESCIEAVQNLPDMERTLLAWLVSMLSDAAEFKHINKMTEQNLAIVVAPNLYNPPSQDPMEGLVLSQKSTQFVHNLILYEIEQRNNHILNNNNNNNNNNEEEEEEEEEENKSHISNQEIYEE